MHPLRRVYLFALVLISLSSRALAQENIGILFYDVDHLYDTIPSLFYDDGDYTPNGRLSWNSERYNQKITNCTAVLDSIRMPIVALYGVENEQVVRDIVSHSSEDYSYIHRTSNSLKGLDFSLLYYGDRLFIESVELQRDFMSIEATHSDERLTIIIAKSGRDIESYIKSHNIDHRLIVAGEVSALNYKKLGLHNLLSDNISRGEGNYTTRKGWKMRHTILSNQEPTHTQSGVYITEWLLTADKSRPLATFNKDKYTAGYSNFLPIYSFFR